MERSTCEEVRKRINSRINELYIQCEDGNYIPYVCLICDEFVKPMDLKCLSSEVLRQNRALLKPEAWNDVSRELAQCYKYKGDIGDYNDFAYGDDDDSDDDDDDSDDDDDDDDDSGNSDDDHRDFGKMLLSPRACFIRHLEDFRHVDGFSCCTNCKRSLKKRKMPKYAIANNYCFGTPPQCLLELSEVELAMLTPVKTYGYCFSYTGGIQKQLKGSLSYYKVDMNSIARAAMHFDVLGLNNNIVVMFYGKMTQSQSARARERSKVRTNIVLLALQWLISNNEEWIQKGIDLDLIRENLRNPLVLDNSMEVDGSDDDNDNNNIEETDSFQVFFPDGTMSSLTGGQENLEQFNEILQAASRSGYDISIRSNLMKEAVSDFRDNNLVNACLLQFPYGRGGMHENRMEAKGCLTSNTDVEEYVQHLTRLSQPSFHHELFTLILYNLSMKQAMVRNAGWRVRNKCDAKSIATELTMEEISEAISTRVSGGRKRRCTTQGHKLLNAVDAIAKAVPHTNEAAKQARSNGECIQHHFGTPSVFLTVTPDDDNSFLVQVLVDEIIDDDRPIESISNEELTTRAKKRTNMRIRYPGVCALLFEHALEIVIEEVIGWNMKKGKAREDQTGLFGKPQAFTATIEEQGRRTLHTHIQVWIKEFNEWREQLHSSSHRVKQNAEHCIKEFIDNISNCEMFFNDDSMLCYDRNRVAKAFPHQCEVTEVHHRQNPTVVDDQSLRNLRQKDGSFATGEAYAYCPHCATTWSSNELLESYLINGAKVPSLTAFPESEVRRLKAMAVEHQKSNDGEEAVPCWIINAAYNHHIHTKSCFDKCGNGKETTGRRVLNAKDIECRYRYPQRPKRSTVIQNASDTLMSWYDWKGENELRHIKEVCPKRGIYDGFQNVCCPAVSYSKLTCNTNIAGVMPGPIGQYSFKYALKGTQKEDTEEYGHVKAAMQKVLSKIRASDSQRSEAVKRLLAASFAHQKTNVVGAAMASYLTRNKSRFIFSHKTVWIPLKDIESLLEGGEANVYISQNRNVPFFQCAALHYICRPWDLENTSAFDLK
jgi:hypothetical protein